MPTDTPDTEGGSPRRVRRLWIVLGVLLLLSVSFRVALPYAIQWGIGWGAMRQFGHVAHLENIDLSFFNGTILIENLVMAQRDVRPPAGEDPGSENALVVLDKAFVDFAWLDLFKGMIHFTRVDVDGPRITLQRLADGRIDPIGKGIAVVEAEAKAAEEAALEQASTPDEAVVADAGPAAEAEAADAGGGWPIVIDTVGLDGTSLHVRDTVDGAELAAVDIGELVLAEVVLASESFGLGGLSLDKPEIRVKREFALDPTGGRTPLNPAGAPPAPEEPPAPEQDEANPRATRLEDLAIEGAAFKLLVGDRELAVTLRLKAGGVSLDPGSTFPLSLGLEIEDGSVEIDGRAGVLPPFFDGKVKITELPVPLIPLFTRPAAADWFKTSRIGADLNVLARLAVVEGSPEPPGVHVDGTFQVKTLDFGDPGGEEMHVKWDALDIELQKVELPLGDAAKTTPLQVELGTVALRSPQIFVTRPSPKFKALLAGSPSETDGAPDAAVEETEQDPAQASAEDADTEPAGPPPEIRIARFEIREGSLRFDDNTVDPAYRGIIDRLEVTADGIQPTAPSVQKLVVDARLPGGSRLDIDGTMGAVDGQMRLDVTKLTLPPMNPYAANAGLQLEDGGLSLGADIEAKGKHWNIESDVTLHNLRLDEGGSKEFVDKLDMPIGLIISVLRSPDGDIAIPVNVEFDETGGGVDVMGIVMGALRQALVGAATIPLKALGGVFGAVTGGGGVRFEPLTAIPGSADAAPGTIERLDGLIELLESRPTLAVRLDGQTGDDDVPFLAEAELADRIAAGGDLPQLGDEEGAGLFARGRIKGALKKRAKGQAIDLGEEDRAYLRRYIEQVDVPDARHAALGNERAEAARERIVDTGRVEADRVLIDPPSRGTPGVEFKFGSVAAEPDPAQEQGQD